MAATIIRPSLNCSNADLHDGMQGIERVAVDDIHAQLLVTFYRSIIPSESYLLSPSSYTLTGGRRLFPRVIKAQFPAPSSPPQPGLKQVLLTLDREGDFSIYTLTVSGPDMDPFFSGHTLRFRLGCDEQFDCRAPVVPLPALPELPVVIDYLSKDYSSFRQALLDFVSVRMPAWTERSEADLGIMLLELFAYTADNLSYLQDRIASEAFLNTATQRRSVAGHLQLIGYQMDEGASAHTWIQFRVTAVHTLETGFKVSNEPKTASEPIIVFESMANARLDPRHNSIALYGWGNRGCCLPPDALSAALDGSYPDLKAGDYLLFADQQGNRDVVRLTSRPVIGAAPFPPSTVGSPPASPPGSPPFGSITIVNWSKLTPLHHDSCVSEVTVSGNLVVATHGETIPAPELMVSPAPGAQRFRMPLSMAPLAHLDSTTFELVAPLTSQPVGAAAGFEPDAPRSVGTLRLKVGNDTWQELPSLLDSSPDAHVYRVEIDDQGQATVVFGRGGTNTGDQQFGLYPPEGSTISAIYRVGGGTAGNVGADILVQAHPAGQDALDWLKAVPRPITNPLPAVGGRDLESRDHARRFAPPGFRKPLEAVTAADYEAAAQGFAEPDGTRPVERAKAAFEWTGSWLTVSLGVEAAGVEGLSAPLASELLKFLDTRRLAGYDLDVTGAIYVPIELRIDFCAKAGFLPNAVAHDIEQVLSSSALPEGGKGFFFPGNFAFGDKLYVGKIYAAVMTVAGVESARIVRMARLHTDHPDTDTESNLSQGYLATGANEVIRLDNDRNFPENGGLTVHALD